MASEGMDRYLNLSERARLTLHLSMCKSCTNFNSQMQMLRKLMHKLPVGEIKPEDEANK